MRGGRIVGVRPLAWAAVLAMSTPAGADVLGQAPGAPTVAPLAAQTTEVLQPGARWGHTAVFDPVRQRLLVFGGIGASVAGEVWALALSGPPVWTRLTFSGPVPPLRYLHAAIYDPVRDRMLVFGGFSNVPLNDVWALSLGDAPAWTQLTPSGTPPAARFYPSAIYDPVRDRVVVYGGFNGNAYFGDAWALTLAGTPAWALITPVGSLPANRREHTAIYDPVRDRMIVYGGTGLGVQATDLWALPMGGTPTWTRLTPGGGPGGGRVDHNAVYDPAGDRMLVFGGSGSGGFSNETWALALGGTPAWALQPVSATVPSARGYSAAVFDAPRSRMVIFGGYGTPGNDAWWFAATGPPGWAFLAPVDAVPVDPLPVFASPVNVSPGSGSIFLGQSLTLSFVVRNGGVTSDDGRIAVSFPDLTDPADGQRAISGAAESAAITWTAAGGTLTSAACGPVTASYLVAEYADADWQASEEHRVTLTVQPPTVGTFAVYVRSTMHRSGGACDWINVVPVGGTNATDQQDRPVTRFAFTVLPAPGADAFPSGRDLHGAVLDAPRQRIVMFGGDTGAGPSNETWVRPLDVVGSWQLLAPLGPGPSARSGAVTVYDPPRQRLIVFGGLTAVGRSDEVWALTLDGAAQWTRLAPSGAPPSGRTRSTSVYDALRDRVLVFGGDGEAGDLNDVWALSLGATPAWSQLAPSGSPPDPRHGHAAVYDPVADRMLVLGGAGPGTTRHGDAWSLALAGTPAWSPVDAPNGPTPRLGATATYDATRNQVWVFGGDDGAPRDDLWTLALGNAPAWTEQFAYVGPYRLPIDPRAGHAAFEDPARDRMVVVGGLGPAGRTSDTWLLSHAAPPTWRAYGAPDPPPPPVAAVPAFLDTPSVVLPASVVAGQSFRLTLRVRNDGAASDDGRIVVGFPSFTGFADAAWIHVPPGGDTPGYHTHSVASTIENASCQPMIAPYLSVDYEDDDWKPYANEVDTFTVDVRPQVAGTFVVDVRTLMHTSGAAACDRVVGLPAGGVAATDAQGFPVRRFTITVLPPAPVPVFPEPVALSATSIQLGQTVTLDLTVRNDGDPSDDGRIIVGFPSLRATDDTLLVTSPTIGDDPGYVEVPVGSTLGSGCGVLTSTYLTVEYRDHDWLGRGTEDNPFRVVVRPVAAGPFYIDIRAALHWPDGSPCAITNAIPDDAGFESADELGYIVKRFTVNVLAPGSSAPDPEFPTAVTVTPSAITLGQAVTVRATVTNGGVGSDDGRILIAFPSLTDPADRAVSGFGDTDVPGHRDFPAGSPLTDVNCQPVIASYLLDEYRDGNWLAAPSAFGPGETNVYTVTVTPKATGTFYVYVRALMHRPGLSTCSVVPGLPYNGQAGFVDQQGWPVQRFAVTVNPSGNPPRPVPQFTTGISGIPTSVVLGENFKVNATVVNSGAASDDGRIAIAFPSLIHADDERWVDARARTGAIASVVPAGGAVSDAGCQPAVASYVGVEGRDTGWQGVSAESHTLEVTVQPQAIGPFDVYVRSTMHTSGAGCDWINGTPPGGTMVTDPQGWAVKKYTVQVLAPSTPVELANVRWQRIEPAGDAPLGRYGHTCVYDPARDQMVTVAGWWGDCDIYNWALELSPTPTWVTLPTFVGPGQRTDERWHHAAIYDPVGQQVVIHGGECLALKPDVMALDLVSPTLWARALGTGTPPSARHGQAAVYDPVRQRMLVIGGYDGTSRNDVWELTLPGMVWTQLSPGGPAFPARQDHSAVYDPVRDRVIVLGGESGGYLNDLWELRLSPTVAWNPLTPIGVGPSARRQQSAIYDPEHDRIVVFGGADLARHSDLWALDLAGANPVWTRLWSTNVGPASRLLHTAIYDAPRHRMLVYGGEVGASTYSDEIWTLTLDGATSTQITLVSADAYADRVQLVWSAANAASLPATVYRRTGAAEAADEWVALGAPVVDGDQMSFDDRDVVAGARYGYRLGVRENGGETFSATVWVTVPVRPALALAVRSPGEGKIDVRFSLPDDRPASLAIFDLSGRLRSQRDVGSLGPGEHALTVGETLPAGVYLVRLTRGGQTLRSKAAVLR